MATTTAVTVTFTLTSNTTAGPPYAITGCAGTVTKNPPPATTFSGFAAMNIGTPQPSGATFNVNVLDTSYIAAGPNAWVSSIGNWALVFIPRGTTSQNSPFGNNAGSQLITGTGGTYGGDTSNPTAFSLTMPSNSNTIQALGTSNSSAGWDWLLMVQVNVPTTPNAATYCFSSDPEMDVTS